MEKFIAEYRINYTIVLDDQWQLVRRYYKADSVPMTFVIDQQGKVYRAHRGLPTDDDGRVDPYGTYVRDIQSLLERARDLDRVRDLDRARDLDRG